MARALIAGHKTQTRRAIRPLPAGTVEAHGEAVPADAAGRPVECRLASAGEVLLVREPWRIGPRGVEYEADTGPAAAARLSWRPGRFMNVANARLTLKVRRVWPQRLASISPVDAAAEGMPPGLFGDDPDAALAWFRSLWDGIYGKGELAWSKDPWVWAIDFAVRRRRRDD